jgi:hypothetical protein
MHCELLFFAVLFMCRKRTEGCLSVLCKAREPRATPKLPELPHWRSLYNVKIWYNFRALILLEKKKKKRHLRVKGDSILRNLIHMVPPPPPPPTTPLLQQKH